MRLYIETMDAILVECAGDGRVRFEEPPSSTASAGQGGEWVKPTVQERRAIIHAAESQLESLKELLETLETKGTS